MSRAELILYATPMGPLANALDQLFARIRAEGPTTAQEYPPHCTLTGFFHRDPEEIDRIAAELHHAEAANGPPPADGIEIVALHRRDDWIGLELESEWLRLLTAEFVDAHAVTHVDDPLRTKDWLHLSIAYGVDDLGPAIAATDGFDITLPGKWEVDLWQRHPNGAWTRHRGAAPTEP